MKRDALIAVRDAKGVRVSCLDGALWITQERLAADMVLEAGQSAVIDSPGLTLLMALKPSTVRLRERNSRGPARAPAGGKLDQAHHAHARPVADAVRVAAGWAAPCRQRPLRAGKRSRESIPR